MPYSAPYSALLSRILPHSQLVSSLSSVWSHVVPSISTCQHPSVPLKVQRFPLLGRLKTTITTIKDKMFQSKQIGNRESKEMNIEGRVQFDVLQVCPAFHPINGFSHAISISIYPHPHLLIPHHPLQPNPTFTLCPLKYSWCVFLACTNLNIIDSYTHTQCVFPQLLDNTGCEAWL